jgi:hypothetical protein
MKIIFLSGKKKCGKTPTFEMLYNKLSDVTRQKPKKIDLFGDNKDFCCVFNYKKKKVALFSSGDSLPIIIDAVFLYSYVGCLIMAFNSDGIRKTDLLNSVSRYKHNKHIIKTVCKKNATQKDKDRENSKDCNKIFKAI